MTPAQWAERRRALVKASRGRRKITSVVPPQPPDALALQHSAKFKRLFMRRIVEFVQELFRMYRIRQDTLHPLGRSFADLVAYFGELFVNDFSLASGALVEDVSKFNEAQLNEVWMRVLKVPFVDKPGQKRKLAEYRAQNIALIKNLSEKAMNEVREVIDANVGENPRTLTKLLTPILGGNVSRASLIARDQTLKINGQLTQERHTAAGVDEYEWVTSNDDRVRPWHRKLNDQHFKWTEPPPVSKDGRHEHPGGDYQCRCIANPVFDLDSVEP